MRLGRLGICCVKKKKMFFGKYTLLFDTSFFVCLIFISSYQVKLGYLDLVSVDCRKFCALFFVCLLRSFFFPLCAHLFPPSPPNFGFFPKYPILEFACWDSLDSFPSLFCSSFLLLFIFMVTAFCSKFSFIKGEPAQLRFHSSEFSVSIMHSSLLS